MCNDCIDVGGGEFECSLGQNVRTIGQHLMTDEIDYEVERVFVEP